jgi:biopolymer transport protein ExbB/TolQ
MSAQYGAAQAEHPWQGRRCGGPFGWKPLELFALIGGFALWWPLGLAVLAWKIAQKKGYPVPDIFEAARSRFSDFMNRAQAQRRPWQPFTASSGNMAFDEWRKAELEKLEEQRRQLDAAEREFAEHMDNLRRARDREEFERFMAARRGSAPN